MAGQTSAPAMQVEIVAPAAQSDGAGNGKSEAAGDPARLFQAGQDALNQNHLEEAEKDFRQVLALDPGAGAAHANLGVVYMRRKQWTQALHELRKAEGLMPDVAGIRLNIGLAYYRQNDYLKAIPLFESVV